ncbi:hypothetical protein H9Q69_009956 [Fusarium xylarioides]|nr:hypothetical protein H9Q69_009956 [Fusarium xylarioides]
MYTKTTFLTFAVLIALTASQNLQATLHTTSWNSTFKLSAQQLTVANLTVEEGAQINNIINFDRTLLANGGPHQDDFYTLPPGLKIPKDPGELIKLQEITDPEPYTIPASTAMSRFLYSTTNINGTLIPASAYILWPYTTKKIKGVPDGEAPTVLWTHGTSGWYPTAAPSTHRSLFYQDFVTYALALAGYAVVAPDYAGLGVGTSWDRTTIPHQYGIYQAGGADALNALNALRAALAAFPERLTTDYVNVGHSQGGAVGWGVSELLAEKKEGFEDLVRGHLGTLLFAPLTDAFSLPATSITTWVGKYLNQVYPEFKLSDWLTPLGIDRVTLFNQVEGSQSVSSFLFTPENEIVQPDDHYQHDPNSFPLWAGESQWAYELPQGH